MKGQMANRIGRVSTRHVSQLMACGVVFTLTIGGCAARTSSGQPAARPVDGLPSRWIDLPESPFHVVVSKRGPALINRSQRTFRRASVGCVQGERVVEVVGLLVEVDNANGWQPGAPVSALAAAREIENNLPNPDYRKLYPNQKYCADGLRVAVVHARADDGYEWSAAGTLWPPGRTTG